MEETAGMTGVSVAARRTIVSRSASTEGGTLTLKQTIAGRNAARSIAGPLTCEPNAKLYYRP